MPLGSEVPEWAELRGALRDLTASLGAESAAVMDESNDLWCAWPGMPAVVQAAARFYEREIASRAGVPLRRGGRLSIAHPGERQADSYLAESFGGIYVLVVWFKGSFEPAFLRARLRRELGRIESLTLALPPPDGPDDGGGAGKMRA